MMLYERKVYVGERFIYFCLENNLIVGKIMFKYKDINMMILNILNGRVKN